MTNNEFIETISSIVIKECNKNGYNFPSAIIAQACNESSYGRSVLGKNYFNYFGMKCGKNWNGKTVTINTKEEYDGKIITVKDNFRVYDSIESGINGYFDFISTKRYSNLKNATSPRNYLELIKSDGYATSSSYVNDVYSIIVSKQLTKYDSYKSNNSKKTNEQIAKEVIKGLWGNGLERKQKLTVHGYNYKDIQKIVNKIL